MECNTTITLCESPNAALQPKAEEAEPTTLVLSPSLSAVGEADMTSRQVRPFFQESKFLRSPDQQALSTGTSDSQLQEFKFLPSMPPTPLKKFTLDDAVTQQMSLLNPMSDLYRNVSEQIVHTMCDSLDMSSTKAISILKDSNTVDKIAQLIEKFVVASFGFQIAQQQLKVSFAETESRSGARGPGLDRRGLDFYTAILPLDLVETAKIRFSHGRQHRTRCVAVTLQKERCKKSSRFVESSFDALIRDLSSMPRPWDFAKVVDILSHIADMVFCSGCHLRKKKVAIQELQSHFRRQSKTSAGREAELRCVDEWLRKLVQGNEVKEEPDRAPTAKGESGLPEPTSLTLSKSTVASTSVSTIQSQVEIARSVGVEALFLFRDTFSAENSSSSAPEITFAANLTHKTLFRYTWAIGKRELSREKLVQLILHQQLADLDLVSHGYIYVYRHAVDFGFVKIGHSIDIQKRSHEWEILCKYNINQCDDLLQDIDRQAPHPKRLEDLIHAELKDKRFEVLRCENCHKGHTEWFEVSAVEAQRIVKKWTLWMQTDPYDECGYLKSGAANVPVVGNCEVKPAPVRPKDSKPPRRFDRRSNGQRQRDAASTHGMKLRPRAPLPGPVETKQVQVDARPGAFP